MIEPIADKKLSFGYVILATIVLWVAIGYGAYLVGALLRWMLT